jgi:hypothetical protein
MAKYGNKKVIYNGIKFDSKREVNRWAELEMLEKAGVISDLQRQVKFTLIPSQRGENGRVIERECSYIADFVYRQYGQIIVEDTKSPATKTKDYIIKRKLMLYIHGIKIKEV